MSDPTGADRASAKDFFLYLAKTAALYFVAFTFTALMFNFVDLAFADKNYRDYYDKWTINTIRLLLSGIIVVFPIFLGLSWLVERDLSRNPQLFEMKTRKWTAGLTLLLAGATLAGDLVYLLYNYLKGELGTVYVLKSLTILVVAGILYGYFLWEGRRKVSPGPGMPFALTASGVMLVSVIAGFYLVGSLGYERNRYFDETRLYDLSRIEVYILDYWQVKRALPATVEEVDVTLGYVKDPETATPYEYRKLSPTSFELCANFKTHGEGETMRGTNARKYKPGKNCFTTGVK